MSTLYRIVYIYKGIDRLDLATYPSATEAMLAALEQINYILCAYPHCEVGFTIKQERAK